MKKIVCIHAHQSNIDYLDRMLEPFPCTVQHEVIQLTEGNSDDSAVLKKKILRFLSQETVACFLTCTVHCGLIKEKVLQGIPILKIEDPIIETLSSDLNDKVLLFTNPATVDLTMSKVQKRISRKQSNQNYEVEVIPDIFDLISKNKKNLYRTALLESIKTKTKTVYLMQLSMSLITDEYLPNGSKIINPYIEAKREYTKTIFGLLS